MKNLYMIIICAIPELILSINTPNESPDRVSKINELLSSLRYDGDKKTLHEKICNTDSLKECKNSTMISQMGTASDVDFQRSCPYIVCNVLNEKCEKSSNNTMQDSYIYSNPTSAWSLAIAVSLIVNLSSVGGFVLFYFLNKTAFEKVAITLMSLAVGILSSNAFFHLLPNALDINASRDPVQFKTFIIMMCGIYIFLFLETLLKSVLALRNGRFVPNLINPCCNQLKPSTLSSETVQTINIEPVHVYIPNNNAFYMPVFLNKNVSPTALLILIGDALHNFIDGLIVGSSFAESLQQGITVSLAIFFEEFAHELGDFATLVNTGMTIHQALFWNSVATLTNIVGCLLGLLMGANHDLFSILEALCAGVFVYISLVVMLPELIERIQLSSNNCRRTYIVNLLLSMSGFVIGISIMIIMAYQQ